MGGRAKQRRKRYAEDPKFRKRVLKKNGRYRRRNRKKLNEQKRIQWQTDPDAQKRHRERRLMAKYGLLPGEYDRMLAKQNGVCKFCKRSGRPRLAVDHCHDTNKVRWLLCTKCNIGLGHFNDDPDLLRVAADCLDEWLGRQVIREGPMPWPLTLTTAPPTRPMADPRCLFSMGPPLA
jgi:Recombination endonuclease VII